MKSEKLGYAYALKTIMQITSPACWKDGMLVFSRWKRLQTTKYESIMNLNCLFQPPFIGRWALGKKIVVSWQQKARLHKAESLTVWVFCICIILSPSSVRKARGQMPATFYPRKGGGKEPKKVCGMLWIFFFFLELHDVEMRTIEPRKGSPSNWKKQCNQVFTSILKMAVAVIFVLCK